jgi:parallel beta-helix repeat protein
MTLVFLAACGFNFNSRQRMGCLSLTMRNRVVFTCFIFFLLLKGSLYAQLPQPGMRVQQSIRFQSGYYPINAANDLQQPLLTIAGENITVDFNDAVLQGSNDKTRPDEFYGLAVRIEKGSKNITIRNLKAHGYKIALLADSVAQLRIENCDLSYNWRQHLNSRPEQEDISDWMSYHHNEKDEWLRYGAAIYLRNCSKVFVQNNTVTGGQCALMMTRCRDGMVADNNFSFNSGIGIGLYRSSHNIIRHNRLDFNVRGYHYGKYKRGQDSAGILVFEQSSDNSFVYNSATHSGDGFFLWAGQQTMDTGEGGSNDNFIYGNNFSFAPTNGVEITFSRNLVMKNRITDCDHGVWGGYSYDTDITDNFFANNRIGVAIEHGQNINIVLNHFTNDKTGIKLWSREKQPSDWIYAQKKNTDSRNYWISANRFTATPVAFDIMGTDTVVFNGNVKMLVDEPLKVGDRAYNLDTSREEEPLDMDYQPDIRLKKIKDTAYPALNVPAGKEQIRITEWGPYDFSYPLLWFKEKDSTGLYHFEVLGPGSSWSLQQTSGFTIIDKGSNSFPSSITARADSSILNRVIQLRYEGPPYKNIFGKLQDSSSASFNYHEFSAGNSWDINWYRWDSSQTVNDFSRFEALFNTLPLYTATVRNLNAIWWGKPDTHVPADSFATVAQTGLQLVAGRYEINLTADDFARVWVDDILVIDAWDPRYVDLDETTHHRAVLNLVKGTHRIKVVHAEKSGLATLQFSIRPAE